MLNIAKDSFRTWQDYKKKIEKPFYLLTAGPLFLFVWAYLSLRTKGAFVPGLQMSDQDVWIGIIVELVLALVLILSKKPKIPPTFERQQFKEKMVVYFKQLMTYVTLFTLFTLINVIGYTLTGLKFFAAMYCMQLVVVSMEMPTLQKMAKLLRLTKDEMNAFYKGEPIKD